MLAQMRCSLPILCLFLLVIVPAGAAEPSFADLLARAQAQAAAGHRWDPPGDNFVETVVTLFSRLPTATPEEIAAFKAMVERDQKATLKEAPPTPAVATPDAQVDAVPPSVATAAPDAQVDTVPPSPAAVAPNARADTVAPPVAAVEPDARVETAPSSPVAAVEPDAAADLPPPPSPPAVAPNSRVDVPPPPSVAAVAPDARPNAPPPATVVTADREPLSAPAAAPTLAPVPLPPAELARPDARTLDLYKRGQAAERRGDISGARRFYAAAVQHGYGTAARSLGRLYDPEYLHRNAIGGIDADAATARHWYERATALGDPEAGPLLQALSSR